MAVKRAIIAAVVGQFGHPRGTAGKVAGWVMAHRSSNRQRNKWVVSLLDVRPTDRVLEVGFGPGLAIAELSRRIGDPGHVYGIDHSDVMLRQAARRNAAAIRAGRITLTRASVDQLPPPSVVPSTPSSPSTPSGSGPHRPSDWGSYAGGSHLADASPSHPSHARERLRPPGGTPRTKSKTFSEAPASRRRGPRPSTSTRPWPASSPSTPAPARPAARAPPDLATELRESIMLSAAVLRQLSLWVSPAA
jgi:methyltransferase family protein